MNKSKLLALRKAVSSEEERRSRINELLKDPNVRELLELKNLDVPFEQTDKESVIESVLSRFSIEDANNIYVVIGAYRFTRLSFNELEFPEKVNFKNRFSDFYLYQNIESLKTVRGFKTVRHNEFHYSDFEHKNIVFNPNDGVGKNNGFDDVRLEYFSDCLKFGQVKALKKLLSKYPRIMR